MNRYLALATLTSFGAMVALLVYNDAPRIFGVVESVGGGLVLVVLIRACILSVAGIGWAKLVQQPAAVRLRVYLLLRWIRESINVLLPVAQVGGDVIGGRLLVFWGVSGGLAGASIIVDLLIQLATQLVFTALGLVILALSGADAQLINCVATGLGISALALFGFYLAQRSDLVRIAESALIHLAKRWPAIALCGVPAIHKDLQAIHHRPRALFASFVLHQAAWFIGGAEIWVALRCMGLSRGWGESLVLESLGQAVRSADFAIPGVMGVQEGGFLILGAFYGIAPEIALALSLVKRVPDLVLGVPGLFLWHLQEKRRPRDRSRETPYSDAVLPQLDPH